MNHIHRQKENWNKYNIIKIKEMTNKWNSYYFNINGLKKAQI